VRGAFFGHVLAGTERGDDRIPVAHDHAAGVDHPHLAVGADDSVVERHRFRGENRSRKGGLDRRPIVGMDQHDGVLGPYRSLPRRKTMDAAQLVGPLHGTGGHVEVPRPDLRNVLRQRQLLAGAMHRVDEMLVRTFSRQLRG